MTAGFGAGANGPLLISVDLSKQPAKPDQAKLDKLQAGAGPEGQGDQQANARAVAAARGAGRAARQAAAGEGAGPAGLDKQIDRSAQSEAQRKQLEQKATDPRLQDLETDSKTRGVKKVSEPLVNSGGTAAVLNVTPTTAPSDRATEDLVRRLRDDTIPKATEGQGHDAPTSAARRPATSTSPTRSRSRPVLTIAVVVALSFLLLMLAFRSIVIPLTAGLMNLVSIGAAFGVVTRRLREGLGREPRRARRRGPDRLASSR